jgi:hypothetical protein
VESILHRTVEKYRLDATELSIKLPDLLIRECEHEIQRVCSFKCFHQQYIAVYFQQLVICLLFKTCNSCSLACSLGNMIMFSLACALNWHVAYVSVRVWP